MLSISNQQLDFFSPNFTCVAHLDDKIATNVSGVFHTLPFFITNEHSIINNVTYKNSHEQLLCENKVTIDNYEYSFCSSNSNFFSLSINISNEECTILPLMFSFERDIDNSISIFPNGTNKNRTKLVEINVSDDEGYIYQICYFRNDLVVDKIITKYNDTFTETFLIEVDELEKIKQLIYAMLGFRELQIVLE